MLSFKKTSDVASSIASKLRSRRAGSGLTQSELATKSGVPLGTLKLFEQTGKVSLFALIDIMRALDIMDALDTMIPDEEIDSSDFLAGRASSKSIRKRARRVIK